MVPGKAYFGSVSSGQSREASASLVEARARHEKARPLSSPEGGEQPGPSTKWRIAPLKGLATQAQALNQRTVARDVLVLEITQKATTLADKEEKSTTRVVVVLVHLAVLGQVKDALRQHRHLDLGRTGVALVDGVLGHDGLLDVWLERHRFSLLIVARRTRACSPGHWNPRPFHGNR